MYCTVEAARDADQLRRAVPSSLVCALDGSPRNMSTPLRLQNLTRRTPHRKSLGDGGRRLSGRLSGVFQAPKPATPPLPRCFLGRRALTEDEITGPLEELEEIILRTAEEYYGIGKGATPSQVDAVVALVSQSPSLADGIWCCMPTGAGKSRIASIWWLVRPVWDEERTLMLMIAPTDAVGDNAVRALYSASSCGSDTLSKALESEFEGFHSLNITSEKTCIWNKDVALRILRGDFQRLSVVRRELR